MKEHKKLYKAGKRWLTATILTASSALLLAGATTVSAHAAGPGDPTATPTTQPATQPANQPATQPGSDNGSTTPSAPSELPTIHDGNVTISGPDQNASRRASLTSQLDAAKATARADSTAANNARVAYGQAQQNSNAASAAADSVNDFQNAWMDLETNYFPERKDYFDHQDQTMQLRASRLQRKVDQLQSQVNSLNTQWMNATGAQKDSLYKQLQDAEKQYQSASNEQNMFENRSTQFMNDGQLYSDTNTDISLDDTTFLEDETVTNLQKVQQDINDFVNNPHVTAGDKDQMQDVLNKISKAIDAIKQANSKGFSGTLPIKDWQKAADQQLQDQTTALANAVKKFNDSARAETNLQMAVNALPIVRSATKTVTRTINFNIPGQSPVTQTATVTGTATMNDDDSAATSYNWTGNGNWAEYTVPNFDGYTHTQNTVAAQNVDGKTSDTTVTVNYTETDAHRYGNDVQLGALTVNVNDAVPQPELLNRVAFVAVTNPLLVSLYRDPSTLVTLPAGTTAAWANPAKVANDVKKEGYYNPYVLVTFPDRSTTTLTEQLHVVDPSHKPSGPTNPSTPSQPANHHGNKPTNPSNNHGMTPTNPNQTNPSNPSHRTTPADQHQTQPSNHGNNNGEQPNQPSNTQPGNTTPNTPSQNTPGANTNLTPANNSQQGTPTTTVNANGNNSNAAEATFATENSTNASAQQLTAAQRASLSAARQALAAKQASQQSANKKATQTLPQTGNQNGSAAILLGAFGGLLGFGLAADKKWLH